MELENQVDGAEPESRSQALKLDQMAASLVGVDGIFAVQQRLKRAMLVEALKRTAGNFTRAAGLLGIRRQAVQQMVAKLDLSSLVTDAKARAVPASALDVRVCDPNEVG
jgi:DNA-binding protein Fis